MVFNMLSCLPVRRRSTAILFRLNLFSAGNKSFNRMTDWYLRRSHVNRLLPQCSYQHLCHCTLVLLMNFVSFGTIFAPFYETKIFSQCFTEYIYQSTMRIMMPCGLNEFGIGSLVFKTVNSTWAESEVISTQSNHDPTKKLHRIIGFFSQPAETNRIKRSVFEKNMPNGFHCIIESNSFEPQQPSDGVFQESHQLAQWSDHDVCFQTSFSLIRFLYYCVQCDMHIQT